MASLLNWVGFIRKSRAETRIKAPCILSCRYSLTVAGDTRQPGMTSYQAHTPRRTARIKSTRVGARSLGIFLFALFTSQSSSRLPRPPPKRTFPAKTCVSGSAVCALSSWGCPAIRRSWPSRHNDDGRAHSALADLVSSLHGLTNHALCVLGRLDLRAKGEGSHSRVVLTSRKTFLTRRKHS